MQGKILRTVVPIGLMVLTMATIRFPLNLARVAGHWLGLQNRLEPTSLHLRGEFVESNLGAAREPDGSVTVRMIAEQYLFVPQCVLVPAGVTVHFRLTSADAVHLLTIAGTGYTIEVVPGAVSQAHFQFAHVGTFAMPCHEFCGAGHYAMRSRLMVVAESQFQALSSAERVNCESH
jgi:cytochrome c oxidase subunit 2